MAGDSGACRSSLIDNIHAQQQGGPRLSRLGLDRGGIATGGSTRLDSHARCLRVLPHTGRRQSRPTGATSLGEWSRSEWHFRVRFTSSSTAFDSRGTHKRASMADKFYRVFVSSTYEDLKEERQEVFDALLKCNCFPVGMEHFPSSNLRSLDLIKYYIDQCDYFVLVSAGIYGSIVPDQPGKISYVEWEYEYAKGRLPCFSFIFKDIGKLLGDKLEKSNPNLLAAFHSRVRKAGPEVKFYMSPAELNSMVLHAFTAARQLTPAVGWIRANSNFHAGQLVGAWELLASNVPGWRDSRIIKISSGSEFAWMRFDDVGCREYIFGYYTLGSMPHYNFNANICEIPRETNIECLKGSSQEYLLEIAGGILRTAGGRSTGGFFQEEFRRIDWSKVAGILN